MSNAALKSGLSKVQIARWVLSCAILIGASILIYQRFKTAELLAVDHVRFEVVEANRRINVLFEAARSVLDSVGEYVEGLQGDELILQPRLDRALDRSVGGSSILAGAIVQDRSGKIVAAAEPRTGVGVTLANIDFFRKVIETQQPGYEVGAPYRSSILNATLIPLAKGIRNEEGKVIGVVSVGLRLSSIQSALAPTIQTPDARSRLWRSDGVLLVSSVSDGVEIGRVYPELPLSAARASEPSGAFIDYHPWSRAMRISAWRENATFPLYVSVGADRNAVLGRDIVELSLILAFASIVFSLLLLTIRVVEREKRQTLAALNERTLALAERTRALNIKNMFLANMSHEFRTPLNAISGYLQMLRMGMYGELGERQSRAIESASVATDHMAKLTDTVLDLSRIEAGKMILDTKRVDVRDLVEDAVGLVKPQADARKVDISILEEMPGNVKAICDPFRGRQIVINLLSNAVRHCKAEGRVLVDLSVEARGKSRVCITDDGPGFGKEPLERYFEPFSERDAMVAHTGGTGLGLALSRSLARAQGGDVSLANRPEGGARVTLVLPA